MIEVAFYNILGSQFAVKKWKLTRRRNRHICHFIKFEQNIYSKKKRTSEIGNWTTKLHL